MDMDWLKKKFGKKGEKDVFDVQKIAKLYYLATVDTKTQLYNYRYFNSQFKRELAIAERYNRHISLAIIDIDNFKQVNDKHGYLRGDEILQMVSMLIKSNVRETDVAARFGGEEFTILMPETASEEARKMAERIREYIMADKFLFKYGITVSIGVAQNARKEPEKPQAEMKSAYSQFMPKTKTKNKDEKEDDEDLFEKANKALRYAKQHGKNRTVVYSDLKKSPVLEILENMDSKT